MVILVLVPGEATSSFFFRIESIAKLFYLTNSEHTIADKVVASDYIV